MEGSQLALFVERLKTDEALRERVIEAEEAAARGLDSIRRIAADAGYDIAGELGRPGPVQPTPTDQEVENAICWLTCCLFETSVWDTEGPSIGGF